MTKPPNKKASQKNYIHSAVRLPQDLNEELKAAAARNGRSMNAEIIARLQASPMDAVMAELTELKRMLRVALDQI
jgi:predicted HicB family RNase H-like nuclease